MSTEEFEHLFSYGTLQIEAVQLATFGRKLRGEPDALPGYRQSRVAMRDPDSEVATGAKFHLNAEFTGHDSDSVAGTVFEVTKRELQQADIYEATADYKRISVQLRSGTRSWVYVSAAVE